MFRHFLVIFLLLICFGNSLFAQVVINEVSNGPTGNKEYVELVVIGDTTCTSNCVDLRGWYIDDNNGSRSPTVTASGIADGCIRFPNIALWSCVKLGSIIVIYEESDRNAKIPADDPTDANNDFVYILPSSSSLLEKHETLPAAGSPAYPTTGFSTTTATNWSNVAMANGDDSFQVILPNGTPLHYVSYGNNTVSPIIYFAGPGNAKVYYLNTFASIGDPFLQANWIAGTAPTNETPGLVNSAGDATYINALRLVSTILPLTASATTTQASCDIANCDGAITAIAANGFSTNYTYSWTTSPTQNTASITNLCAGNYTVFIEDARHCKFDTTITINATIAPTVSAVANSPSICNGSSSTLTASGTSTYTWLAQGTFTGSNSANVTVTPSTTTIYTVIGSDGTCSDTTTVQVVVNNSPTLNVTPTVSLCSGSNTTLSATGAVSYSWFSPTGTVLNTTDSNLTISPTTSGVYTVIGTSNGCSVTATSTVTVNSIPTVSITASETRICEGSTVNLSATGATNYTWSPAGSLNISNLPNVVASPITGTTYTVVGSNGNCSNSATIYMPVDHPPLDSIKGSTSICGGSSTSVTLTLVGAVTNLTWVPQGNFSGGSTNAVTLSPSVTTTYTVYTSLISCKDTLTATVTVNSPPTIVTNQNISMCLGNTTTLSATGALNYTWFSPAGVISTSSATVDITPTVSGVYTYNVKGDNNGCTASKDVIVTVNQIPILTTSNNATICDGHSVSLTASGATNYTWSPTTGLDVSNVTTVNASPHVNTSYTVTGLNGICTDDAIIDVTVNPSPTVSISGNLDLCTGQSTTLNLSGSPNYSWNPTTFLTNQTTSNVTIQPTATTTYTITGYNTNCSVNTVITVNLDQPANIVVNGPFSYCIGGSAQLTASGALNYTWSPTTSLSSTTINNPITTTPSTVIYTVAGTNVCPGSGDVKTITVTVFPKPTIIASPKQDGCAPFKPTFSATSASPGITCHWELSNDASLDGCTNMTTTINTKDTIDAKLMITDANGCKDSTLITSFLIAHESPIANFDYSPQPVTSFTTSVDLANQSTDASNYNWTFNETSHSTLINPNFTIKDTGTIAVNLIATNQFGCSDTITKKIPVLQEFVIYIPNTFTPNADVLNEEFKVVGLGISDKDYEFNIFNRWGEIVFTGNSIKDTWDGKIKGKHIAPEDVYVYKLKFNDMQGNSYKRKGHINVIK